MYRSGMCKILYMKLHVPARLNTLWKLTLLFMLWQNSKYKTIHKL